MKINFKIHSLINQKPTDITHAFIDFQEPYFTYNVRFHADELKDVNDLSLGYENILNIYEIHVPRLKVCGFEKSWLPTVKLFLVSLVVQSFTNDLRIHFKRESEADEFLRVFGDWLYNPVFHESQEQKSQGF